jgi:hypothetical protein
LSGVTESSIFLSSLFIVRVTGLFLLEDTSLMNQSGERMYLVFASSTMSHSLIHASAAILQAIGDMAIPGRDTISQLDLASFKSGRSFEVVEVGTTVLIHTGFTQV